MTISQEMRNEVRRRANFACEFCGVTETDTAGQFTIDHFKPKSKGGSDKPDNLLYSCVRCNLYKQNCWPDSATQLTLWNPHLEPASDHFLELEDGTLFSLTAVGEFTIRRLRLNRDPLIAFRRDKRIQLETSRILAQYRDLLSLLNQLNSQLATLTIQQQELLFAQKELLNLFLDFDED